jgi:hypothetical protein
MASGCVVDCALLSNACASRCIDADVAVFMLRVCVCVPFAKAIEYGELCIVACGYELCASWVWRVWAESVSGTLGFMCM